MVIGVLYRGTYDTTGNCIQIPIGLTVQFLADIGTIGHTKTGSIIQLVHVAQIETETPAICTKAA
jgi:hypothetical protein